ncbi:MAG: hypothetical protein GY858_00485 [Candidatus Omnitrophica bacterium]|nr:hypothetical protein [Candidatus Omnitrophota bacterium]
MDKNEPYQIRYAAKDDELQQAQEYADGSDDESSCGIQHCAIRRVPEERMSLKLKTETAIVHRLIIMAKFFPLRISNL